MFAELRCPAESAPLIVKKLPLAGSLLATKFSAAEIEAVLEGSGFDGSKRALIIVSFCI